MALIKSEWLDSDRHAKMLDGAGWYFGVSDTVDNDLIVEFENRGIKESEIPVDVLGFIDSRVLRKIGTNYALFRLFSSNWGVRDSADIDIFKEKAWRYDIAYSEGIEMLTRSMVI